jgi:tetratricopeptide (TPR) repeat protein
MLASRVVIAAWALGAITAAAQPAPPDQPAPAQPAAEGSGSGSGSDQAATPPPVEKPPAVVAFEEGRALMEAHEPAQACAKFEQSIRLDPDAAGTMLNLGLCNAEIDRTATALRWFRKALTRSTENNLDAAYVEAARAKSVDLAQKVPILTVTAPKTSTVTLDGEPVAAFDLLRIEVDPGVHTLVMTMPNEKPVTQDVTAHDGDHRNITLKLPPVLVLVDHGAAQRRRAYMIGAAGLGVWALDAGLLVWAKGRSLQADHPDDLATWKNVARYGGTSLFLAGGAVVAYSLYLYTTAPGKERVEQERAFVPIVGPDAVGVAAYGSF